MSTKKLQREWREAKNRDRKEETETETPVSCGGKWRVK